MVRKGVGERQTNMLGIDVSKNTLACALMDDSRNIVWEDNIPNSKEGIITLLNKVSNNITWVLEPTGRYGLKVAIEGLAEGRDLRIASPRKAKQFLQSVQSRAKTDKLDSRGLALYGQACTLPAYPVKKPDVDMLDQLLSARKGISGSISRLQQQQQELPLAASVLEPALADMKRHLKDLDRQIAEKIKSTPSFESANRLDEVQGIGPVTAAAVCSRLVSKSFAHPDQFVAYCGLDIGVRQSGKRSGETGLTKQGDAELRRLLYCAAQSNLRCKSSPFKDQYQRELEKGLSKTGALCAVARKLAKVCWSIHKHGTTYEASRVAKQPEPKIQIAEPRELLVNEKSVPDVMTEHVQTNLAISSAEPSRDGSGG